jgi:hypothetical protein
MRVGATVWWAVLVDERQGGEHDAAAAGSDEPLIDWLQRKAEIATRIEELNRRLEDVLQDAGPERPGPGQPVED